MKWLCSQLGAREHYAISRALFRLGALDYLITDAWILPSSALARLSASRLADRFHNELRDAHVISFNRSLILFETLVRAGGLGEWEKITARNRWFQRKVVRALASDLRCLTSDSLVLLSYSYTALEPFRYAKSRRWKTVLIQIDPGPEEERIVAEEVLRVPALAGEWQAAPADYWACWRQECDLGDHIIVNSEWSREGLTRSGVPAQKISIIPLAYEGTEVRSQKAEVRTPRSYPARFTFERPMRVLFLGQVNLRKGIARLLEAARALRHEPVEFWIVGPVQIANGETAAGNPTVKWFGSVTRKEVTEFYRNADVFILPTLSDGFAITQLEAQAYGLPIIASKFCGKVVESEVNGIILEKPTADAIVAAVHSCIADPDRLRRLAAASIVPDELTIDALTQQLQELNSIL